MSIKHLIILFLSISVLSLPGCATQSLAPNPKLAAKHNARLGAEYLRKGRIKLADEKLKKALNQNPKSAEAHHYYALLQQVLKHPTEANRHFLKALEYDADNPEIHNNYGSFLCSYKNFANAEVHFLKAIKDPLYATPAFALTNAGVCASDNNKPLKAKEYLNKALEKQANFSPALYAMAKLAYDQRNYSRSQAFLFRYNETAGENAKSLALCKQIHVQLGDIKKADECSAKLLRLYPNSKEAMRLD